MQTSRTLASLFKSSLVVFALACSAIVMQCDNPFDMSTNLGDKILRDQDPKNNDFGLAFKEISDSVAVTAAGSFLAKDDSSGVHTALGGTGSIKIGSWGAGKEHSVGYLEFVITMADLGLQAGSKDSVFRKQYNRGRFRQAWLHLPSGSETLDSSALSSVSAVLLRGVKVGAQRIRLSDSPELGAGIAWVKSRAVDATISSSDRDASKKSWNRTAILEFTTNAQKAFGDMLRDTLDTLANHAANARTLQLLVDSTLRPDFKADTVSRRAEGRVLLSYSSEIQRTAPASDSLLIDLCKAHSQIINGIMNSRTMVSPVAVQVLLDIDSLISAYPLTDTTDTTLLRLVRTLTDDATFRSTVHDGDSLWSAIAESSARRDSLWQRRAVLGFAVLNHSDSTMEFLVQTGVCRPELSFSWEPDDSTDKSNDTIQFPTTYADFTVFEDSVRATTLSATPFSSWGPDRTTELTIDFSSIWGALDSLPVSALLEAHVKVTVGTIQVETFDSLGLVFRVSTLPGSATDSLTPYLVGTRVRAEGQEFQVPVKQFLISALKTGTMPRPTAHLKIALVSLKSTLGNVLWSIPSSNQLTFEAVLATPVTVQE